MFQDVAGSTAVQPGLYRVVVPLFGAEKPAMRQLAQASESWTTSVQLMEKLYATGRLRLGWPPIGGGFRYRFPRTNRLNPRTGLDALDGMYLPRKGYDEGAGTFWCLVAVTAVASRSPVSDLFDMIVSHTPGLFPLALGSRQARRAVGLVRFQRYAGAVAAPQPSTGVKPIPAPAPTPSTTPKPTTQPSTPKPGVPATTPVQKVAQTATAAADKTVQTTRAVTAKASVAARQNPWAVVAGIGAGLLLLNALQRRNA